MNEISFCISVETGLFSVGIKSSDSSDKECAKADV